MGRLSQWIVCTVYGLAVLPLIVSITVSMDKFKFCDNNPYFTLQDDEELIIVAKRNKSTSLIGEILDTVTSIEVSYCKIMISPKRSSSKQYMKAVFEKLDITDCKVKVTIRESTPSQNIDNKLSEISCGDTKPDNVSTTKAKYSLSVVLTKDVKPSDGFDFRIKVSLWEGPDNKGGLSFAVKLVIGIACGIAAIIFIVLIIKTILYKRRVKKEEEDDDIPETLPMRSATTEAERDVINEKEMYMKQDMDSPSPNDIKPQPPSYNELYDK